MHEFDRSLSGVALGDPFGRRDLLGMSALPRSLMDLGFGRDRDARLGDELAMLEDDDMLDSPLAPVTDLMPPVQPIVIRLDVEEMKDQYAITAEVPGLKPSEIKVRRDTAITAPWKSGAPESCVTSALATSHSVTCDSGLLPHR